MAKQVPARNGGTLTRPDKGETMNPKGRPKGTISRATIARKVLAMVANYPENIFAKLKEQYPTITQRTTIEEMMTIVMADKLLDSAFGKPKAEVDLTNAGEAFKPATVIIQVDDK